MTASLQRRGPAAAREPQDANAALLSGTSPTIDLRAAVVAAAPRPLPIIAAGRVPREGAAGRRLHDAAPRRVDLSEIPVAGISAVRLPWQAADKASARRRRPPA